MIVDNLENLAKYKSVNPLFEKVLKFIADTDFNAIELGKHEIERKALFVNIQETSPKSKEQAKLETHDKYIDIQIPLSGCEVMGYTPRTSLPEEEYNEVKDITFYKGLAENYISIKQGMFAAFFPQDAHAPGITPDGVKKIIFKILV